MATIGTALASVKEHLDQCVNTQQIEDICRQEGHRWRKCVLNPVVTVHLFLLQLLGQMALTALPHASKLKVTAQAICAAKQRLPLGVLQRLISYVCPAEAAGQLWHGLEVFIADGMSFMTEDTPELRKKFGKARNQRGKSNGRPLPKMLATLDLGGGFIRKVILLPWARQERMCLTRLLKALPAGAMLLGDRGLGGYGQFAMMIAAGVQGCMRLPRGMVIHGRGKGNRRCGKRQGRQDMRVIWRRGQRCAWMSTRSWKKLPEQLELRQISYRITRKGYRPKWAWIITTLTDAKAYPAEELVKLYEKRWQVEVCFRDLKKTLKMGLPSAKSVTGMRKEVLAFVLLYNLVRQVMLKAAAKQGVDPDRISFSDAAKWLLWSTPGEALAKLKVNPKRKRASQPRALKHARKRFPQLKGKREDHLKPMYEAKL